MKQQKKHITMIGSLAICAVFVFLLMHTNAMAQASFRNLSLGELSTQLQTPEAIARYIWKNFAFESDRRLFGVDDYWQSPEEFLQRGKGDCEDFSFFAHDLLKRNGLQSFVVNLYRGNEGHSLAVFKQNGKYFAIDDGQVIQRDSGNLKDLLQYVYPGWKKMSIHKSSDKAPNQKDSINRISQKIKKHKLLSIFS